MERAQAAADDLGPTIGTTIPEFRLADASGTEQTLESLAGDAGLVLYFNRSLDWCPFCQAQVIEIDANRGEFESRGYGIAVITYDPVETLAMYAERRDISIALLADPESLVVDAFNVRDPIYTDPEHYAFGVPFPVTFVLGANGQVRAKFWHEPGLGQDGGYRTRISIDDVLGSLDALD